MIDEPERHLHPALERQAAAWLKKFAANPATQVVIATHSAHFLRLTGDVVWNFIEPRAGTPNWDEPDGRPPSSITTFRPHEQDAFGPLATTMGFDRGELLAGASLILSVEGDADMRVLHELFGPELHAAGVAMFPIQGVANAEQKGLADAEFVLRYTSARLSFLVDDLSREAARRLLHDTCFRQWAMGSRSKRDTELRAMARVIQRALLLERTMVPISIPVHDIFDLLDQDMIKARYPAFPGHSAAREAAAKEARTGRRFMPVCSDLTCSKSRLCLKKSPAKCADPNDRQTPSY